MGRQTFTVIESVCDNCGVVERAEYDRDSAEIEWSVPEGWFRLGRIECGQRQGGMWSPETLSRDAIACSAPCLHMLVQKVAERIVDSFEIPF